MFPKTNLRSGDFPPEMVELTKQYNNLTLAAERCRRDSFGKMTVQEAEYYNDAAKVCEQIINMNLTEDAIRQKWMGRKKACLRIVEEIADKLAPKPVVSATPPKTSTPAKQPTTPPAEELVKTDSGFVTKNACEAVSAEEIKSWYRKKPSVTFDGLVGMEHFKGRVQAWKPWPDLDKLLGLSRAASWFFHGLPGTGKSMCMRAIAAELMDAGYRYIALSDSDLRGRYLGETEQRIQAAFQEAMDNAPCVLVIEDIDVICRRRGDPNVEVCDARSTLTMLQCLSALIESKKQVLLLSATCYPDRVDGWFIDHSHSFRFSLPNTEERTAFFSRHFGNLAIEEGFSSADMAEATDNYSYRDLEKIVENIAMKISELAMAQCMVYDENGAVDQDASYKAAAEAVAARQFTVTRAMFQEALDNNPPTNTAEIRERLRAFEESH